MHQTLTTFPSEGGLNDGRTAFLPVRSTSLEVGQTLRFPSGKIPDAESKRRERNPATLLPPPRQSARQRVPVHARATPLTLLTLLSLSRIPGKGKLSRPPSRSRPQVGRLPQCGSAQWAISSFFPLVVSPSRFVWNKMDSVGILLDSLVAGRLQRATPPGE
ncbi:unnamed protein product [Darwinula stevensoni]|uniref:Uncharacterized protein n=1 Tax=Darwinula stevensoni TaxID=69355 RepID=A0A7R8XJ62_9CRUS|nr:unnamed protein product [Darwinula stevensoni]CAG0891910.1 unnamed protein product [Darwinula stevensoni]